mgnify:CR=1 FL=1
MKQKTTINFLTMLFLAAFFAGCGNKSDKAKEATDPTPREVLEKMIGTAMNLKTVRYEMKISERVNNKMLDAGSRVKLNLSPRKIYLKIILMTKDSRLIRCYLFLKTEKKIFG